MKTFLWNTLGVLVIAFGLVSCQDEDKDPWKDFTNPNGAMVLLDEVTVPVFDATDLSVATYEAELSDPIGNVASYTIQVSLNGGDLFDLKTITTFPHSLVVTGPEMATALGLTSVADLKPSDRIDFVCTVTSNDGTLFTKADLGDNLFGNPGQRQGYEYTTFISCPFNVADAVGTYTMSADSYSFPFITPVLTGIEVVEGANENQIILKDVYKHPESYDVAVDVNPLTGEATVTDQVAWKTENKGFSFGETTLNGDGFVFSCTGQVILNVTHCVSAGCWNGGAPALLQLDKD